MRLALTLCWLVASACGRGGYSQAPEAPQVTVGGDRDTDELDGADPSDGDGLFDGDADAELPSGDGSDGDAGVPLVPFPNFPLDCAALPAPAGAVVDLTTADNPVAIQATLDGVAPDTTVRLAAGTYSFGDTLHLRVEGTTLRSASGDPGSVTLLFASVTGLAVDAPRVTVAELTLTNASDLVHVDAYTGMDLSQTLLYRVRGVDFGDTAIVFSGHLGGRIESSVIACSTLQITDGYRGAYAGGGGMRIQGTRKTWIFRNVLRDLHGLDVSNIRGIVVARGDRLARIERNLLENVPLGLRLGLNLTAVTPATTWPDNPCPDADYSDAYEVRACGNVLWNAIAEHDSGILPWAVCNATIAHNTVFGSGVQALDVRGTATVELVNNLLDRAPRIDAAASVVRDEGNVVDATAGYFIDAAARDLHLAPGAPAIGAGVTIDTLDCPSDYDGEKFATPPDAGADQR